MRVRLYFSVILAGFSIVSLRAQCSGVPAAYNTTCTELDNYLNSFQTTLNSQWNGQKSPVLFSGEMLAADANRGLHVVLDPQTFNQVLVELNGYALVGNQAVTIAMGFPLLYQPFYSFQGMNPGDFSKVLSFYQAVVNEAHKRGLKVVVETSVMFPNVATDLPLTAYYATLSDSQITDGRAQTALTIAQQIKPDFINLGSEPDTQSALLGSGSEYTPQQYATLISTILTELRGGGIHGQPLIGAGIGTWQTDAASYIQALVATDLDYIDFHIYSANLGFLADAPAYIDMAHAAGKAAAISEAWLKKVSDEQLQGKSDLGVIQQFSSSQTNTTDAYSFWAPLDAQFMTELVDLANWKNLLYISPFATEYFFSYVDYSQAANMSNQQVQATATMLATTAMQNGDMTVTGQAYSSAVAFPSRPVTVSAASGADLVASDSLVSIFAPLLGPGASIMVTDNQGTQAPATLFYDGPAQINAAIPPGLRAGLLVLTITTLSGGQTSAVKSAVVAPGLFAANQDGKGVAAAQVVTNQSSSQTIANVFTCSGGTSPCTAIPIHISGGNSALVLYGTGIRNRVSLADVSVTIGAQTLPVFYAGAAPGYVALDQVNVLLPASLAGSGSVNLSLSVAGAVSNVLSIDIQ